MRVDKLKLRIFGDIQRELAKALSRRGVAAELSLTNDMATLRSPAGSTRAGLGDLPRRWRRLTNDARKAQIDALAEQLAADFLRPAVRGRRGVVIALLVIGLLTTALGVLLVRGAVPVVARTTVAADGEPSRSALAASVCEATRSRVMRGATVGPADHEGWVAELALVTAEAGAGAAAAAGDFFAPLPSDRLKVAWGPASELVAIDDGFVEVETRRAGELTESVFVLRGGYVRAYFDALGREAWQRFATALAKQVDARYGGLYARCAHLSAHHVGSWYVGENDGAAAAALVYYDALFSEAPILRAEYLTDPKQGERPSLAPLLALTTRASGVDRTQLAMWTSTDEGLVSTFAERTMLKFPYRDSNRASRSSVRVARRLGVTTER